MGATPFLGVCQERGCVRAMPEPPADDASAVTSTRYSTAYSLPTRAVVYGLEAHENRNFNLVAWLMGVKSNVSFIHSNVIISHPGFEVPSRPRLRSSPRLSYHTGAFSLDSWKGTQTTTSRGSEHSLGRLSRLRKQKADGQGTARAHPWSRWYALSLGFEVTPTV